MWPLFVLWLSTPSAVGVQVQWLQVVLIHLYLYGFWWYVRIYGNYAPLYGRAGAQSTCCAHEGRTSTVLSVRVVIEAPNESNASVSIVLFLYRTTTEASSLPPLPIPACTYLYCFDERNNYCFERLLVLVFHWYWYWFKIYWWMCQKIVNTLLQG